MASSNKKRNGFLVALNQSISEPADGNAQDAFYGWDWTQTTHEGDDLTVKRLVRALDGTLVVPGKGLLGWPMSLESFDADGYKLGQVFFGGGRNDVHFLATSAVADSVRSVTAEIDGAKTSRVDTRVDTLMDFDRLYKVLRAAADTYHATMKFEQSYNRDGSSAGRTWTMGSPRSRIRVRVYEKWLESLGQYVEGTNRVEVMLRPDSQHKADVSTWDRAQTFCASKTTRDLAQRLGADYAPKADLRVSRGTPDLEQSLKAMGSQYGKVVDRWLKVSGGDIDTVIQRLVAFDEETRDLPAEFGARLVEDQRALDDLLRGSTRVVGDPEPPV